MIIKRDGTRLDIKRNNLRARAEGVPNAVIFRVGAWLKSAPKANCPSACVCELRTGVAPPVVKNSLKSLICRAELQTNVS